MLETDMAQLQALFFAEGAGLDPDIISTLCQPLAQAMHAMSQDTEVLIQQLKQARRQPLSGAGSMDSDIMLRVLCHRADYAASKFLKTE